MSRLRCALGAALLVALPALGGCSDDGPGEGEARLDVDGIALVTRADGSDEEVTGGKTLSRGETVELVEGTGRLRFHGGAVLELREGIDDAADTMVTVDDTPRLSRGDLLVDASRGEVDVDAADTIVSVRDGAGRVSRALGINVAMYDAVADVDSAGVERAVPALRRLDIAVLGRPARELHPIAYDGADPWDRRYLGDAIELGERLEGLSAAYTGSLRPGEGSTVGFYKQVLPGLASERAFTQALVDRVATTPGERLIGAAITDLGRRGSFEDRWSSVFGFRSQGAAWGIVALDQAVNREPLVGSVEEALSVTRDTGSFAFAPPGAPAAPGGPDQPSAPDDGGGGPGGSGGQSAASTTTTAPSTSPTTSPPPTTTQPPQDDPTPTDPVTDLLDPADETIGGVLDGLLGG